MVCVNLTGQIKLMIFMITLLLKLSFWLLLLMKSLMLLLMINLTGLISNHYRKIFLILKNLKLSDLVCFQIEGGYCWCFTALEEIEIVKTDTFKEAVKTTRRLGTNKRSYFKLWKMTRKSSAVAQCKLKELF